MVSSSYTTSDRWATITKEFEETLADWTPSWTRFARLLTEKTAALRMFSDQPSAVLNTWNGADSDTISTPSVGATHTQTLTLDGKAGGVHIRAMDLALQPNLVEQAVSRLYDSVTRTIESVVYTALEDTFSDTVDNGNGGTTAICSTGHEYYPIGYTSGGLSSQSNKVEAALEVDALSSAFQLMQSFKSHKGVPAGYGVGPTALIVSPANADLAHQLAKSSTSLTYTPDSEALTYLGGARMNPRTLQGIDVVVSPYLTASNANDWWLVDSANTPVFVWMPFSPKIVIFDDYANHATKITISCFLKAGVQTPPGAIVGSFVS